MKAKADTLSKGSSLALQRGEWTQVSFNEYVLAFLRAEQQTNVAQEIARQPSMGPRISSALDAPDLTDSEQNWLRLRLLNVIRSRYIAEIPGDTVWHTVRSLTDDDLPNLFVTRHATWTSIADNNELGAVARRKPIPLRQQPSGWTPVILWGHERAGPFTIIEGNHRLVSYVSSGGGGLKIPVLVGLSATSCYWHPPDPARVLVLDMWQ